MTLGVRNFRFRQFNLGFCDANAVHPLAPELDGLSKCDGESVLALIREHKISRLRNINRWIRAEPRLRETRLRLTKLLARGLEALVLGERRLRELIE